MAQFLTRKRDGQAFPVNRKVARDSGSPFFVGVDKSQIENNPEHELSANYDSRKSFYGKANVRTEDGKIILRSYSTDVAYIKDGVPVVKGSYSPTTLRHIKEFLKQHGHKADTSKQMLKDYPETKKQEESERKLEKEKSDSQFRSVAMVSSLGNVFHKDDIKERNKWKLRMIKAGMGKGFHAPDDWDKLPEKEKEKRLDNIIDVMKSKK